MRSRKGEETRNGGGRGGGETRRWDNVYQVFHEKMEQFRVNISFFQEKDKTKTHIFFYLFIQSFAQSSIHGLFI